MKQGGTKTFDPYGSPLTGTTIPDNQAGSIDFGWLGQHQRPLEAETGTQPLIEMGARGYNPVLGRFLETDPIEGGNANTYIYPADPINLFDLNGLWCASGVAGHAKNGTTSAWNSVSASVYAHYHDERRSRTTTHRFDFDKNGLLMLKPLAKPVITYEDPRGHAGIQADL